VSDALCALAPSLGFRVVRSLESSSVSDTWVVAAGMSSVEDHPLVRSALASGVQYVAMVSSRKRADALRSELLADGINAGALKAPAGLDIGAATPAEIALSILAEIVQRRRATQSVAVQAASRATAIDPICGMDVDIATAKWTAERDGQTYYFCAPGCRNAFLAA
jgi:xanthine dehydrogenase accessory factor